MNSSGPEKRKKTNENIQVYVRVRPTNNREKTLRSNEIVEVYPPKELYIKQSHDGRITKKFTFDKTFGPDSHQNEVYATVVAPLIEEVLAGYNCTVFAYGQTGTGKTYTMVGNEEPKLSASSDDDDITGIIPRSLSHLFDDLRLMGVEYSMRISYLELYNEELCDLLSTDDSVKIRIFDDAHKKGSVIIQNLEEIPVHNKNDVYKLLAKGQERRKTAATLMNSQSSRSHTVFSILVHMKETNNDGEEMLRTGKLNLVDLAGSENISKSGNEKGIRARETVNINQSLLTLGRVITALVEKGPHVPYRESKLTRILQESLGGRTKTSIIATISPGHKDIEETLSTLEYAHRAKNIENRPEVNQRLTKRIVLKEYTEEIDRLKRDLMAARDKNGIYLPEDTYTDMLLKMENQTKELNDKMLLLKCLKDELQLKQNLFNEVSLNLNKKTEDLKRTEHNLNNTQVELQTTKKVLRNTKRKFEEKKVVLAKHMETEVTLTNQAKDLIKVADDASADTRELHEAIERRKKTEEENLTKLQRFSMNFNSNTDAIKHNLAELLSSHEANSKKMIQGLTINNEEHQLFSNLIQTLINEIKELQKSSYTNLEAVIQKHAVSLTGSSSDEMNIFSSQSKEIIDLNTKQVNEICSKLESIKKLNSLTSEKIVNDHSHLMYRINTSAEHVRNKVSSTMEKLSKSCAANEYFLNSESDNMEQLITSNINITQTQKEHLAKSLQHLNHVLESVSKFEANSLQLNEKVKAIKTNTCDTSKSQNENIKEIETFVQTEFGNSVTEIIDFGTASKNDHLINSENSIEQVEKINNTLTYNDAVITIARKNLVDITKYNQNLSSKLKDNNDELKTQINRIIEDTEHRLGTAVTEINKESERTKQFASYCLNVNESADKTISDQIFSIKNNVLTCEEDVEVFHKHDVKKYTSTGKTPAGKDFKIIRNLAATSPAESIIRRYRQEKTANKNLCSSILSENEENTRPEGIIGTLDGSIESSTPVKIVDRMDDSKVHLKELQVSQIMNKSSDPE